MLLWHLMKLWAVPAQALVGHSGAFQPLLLTTSMAFLCICTQQRFVWGLPWIFQLPEFSRWQSSLLLVQLAGGNGAALESLSTFANSFGCFLPKASCPLAPCTQQGLLVPGLLPHAEALAACLLAGSRDAHRTLL